MGLKLKYFNGQTPLNEDEKAGLKIKTISTRQDLDEFEQNNIEKAIAWSLSRSFTKNNILSLRFILELHKRMFGEVWEWAGNFRKTNKNIGVDKSTISTELKKLIDDLNYWVENKTYHPDEIAVRAKYRLVSTHLFSNGNGRHSRLYGDLIISKIFFKPVFSWGKKVYASGVSRNEYLKALHAADNGNMESLIKFARL
ncbi:MAG TPA: mobile mystery protein B [Spirochaetota bacterium]|nr:mobile mystery protein B [Spirochaetota bacterium]